MTPKELTKGKRTYGGESPTDSAYEHRGAEHMSEIKVIKTSYIADVYRTRSTRS